MCTFFKFFIYHICGFPGDSNKEFTHQCMSLLPGSGRSPGERNGNSLQCSCLGDPIDREA